jgi:hypothetical protein
MPMLVSAGSMITAATSPWASSRSRPARSLYSATRLVAVTSTGAPTLPGRLTASFRESRTISDSSTEPW